MPPSLNLATPFVDLDRDAWARLSASTPLPLTDADVERLAGLGDPIDLAEVDVVYRPISRLLDLHIEATRGLHAASSTFLREDVGGTPFVIGVAGSVAVGKSTTARVLRELLARWPATPRVQLVTTDGFLYSNAELARRGLMERKGFPESYDRRALLRFVSQVKAGRPEVRVPVYDHLTYDIVPGREIVVSRPDVLIVEGLNVLQPARPSSEGPSSLAVSDFFDFSIYVDARTNDVRQWYVDRFLQPARDRVRPAGVVLPPVRRAERRRGGRARRVDLGLDQRPEPAAEHPADAQPRHPRADQGPRPRGPARPAAQALGRLLHRVLLAVGLLERGERLGHVRARALRSGPSATSGAARGRGRRPATARAPRPARSCTCRPRGAEGSRSAATSGPRSPSRWLAVSASQVPDASFSEPSGVQTTTLTGTKSSGTLPGSGDDAGAHLDVVGRCRDQPQIVQDRRCHAVRDRCHDGGRAPGRRDSRCTRSGRSGRGLRAARRAPSTSPARPSHTRLPRAAHAAAHPHGCRTRWECQLSPSAPFESNRCHGGNDRAIPDR